MEMKGKTLILGASENPSRYSYLALKKLRASGIPVVAIGKKEGRVEDVEITKQKLSLEGIDTVTLYLNPQHQKEYYEYIISLKPKRIIFNPGTENPELEKLARENNIQPLEACTLVMLSTGQY
jgi:predicted CoA-binding protein